ncbi:hypothetical protein PF0571 [Pyrococcus furiosus DSM 3638]|uniref:Uncharacterized protein n=2 Tax=Thermococcaceae TaxID=2259 RepID=Q8U399_PYRFU|nr:hypothetical protein PF0571 [Pyrococcus furiosus DSM 3638]MDK2869411.1 hypothetical protein [Pyrococcus sp.]
MDDLDIKFAVFVVVFILIGAYFIGIPELLSKDKEEPSSPYVYPREYIEEMREQFSLVNFSDLTTDESLIPRIKSLFSELNSTRKCSILMGDMEKDFYSAKIYTFVPTFAYLIADKMECNNTKGNVSLALSEVEKLLNEIREIEETRGQSPWLTVAELYLGWSQNPNMTSVRAALTTDYLIPFIREHIDDKYMRINFGLSNISETRKKIIEMEEALKEDKLKKPA